MKKQKLKKIIKKLKLQISTQIKKPVTMTGQIIRGVGCM